MTKMSEIEEKLRAELIEAERLLDEAASQEKELRDHRTGTLAADAKVFQAEARKRYLQALKRFTGFVRDGFLQADIGHLRLFLERHCGLWIGAVSRGQMVGGSAGYGPKADIMGWKS
jgi:hypothetical protein